jgi:hypothetical protein
MIVPASGDGMYHPFDLGSVIDAKGTILIFLDVSAQQRAFSLVKNPIIR